MIESKCNEHGLESTGTGFPNSDKQHSIAAKKTALRDLQNEIVVPKPIGSPPFLKDKVPTSEVTKVSGTKRPAPEGPTSPQCRQSPGSNGTFVYIRRKSDHELVKTNGSDNTDRNVNDQQYRQMIQVEQETTRQNSQVQGPKISSFPALAPMAANPLLTLSSVGPSVPHSHGKLVNVLPTTVNNHPTATSEALLVNPQGLMNNRNWKERFPHLQTFLRNCDHSNQEEYIQMLKSLSSAGRSRHAVELEKRAIQLLLDEGKELHRMKVLNVLGKVPPKNNPSPTNHHVHSAK